MYQIENTRPLLEGGRRGLRRPRWPRVGRNVFLLGLTSLFTDISSEMVATILPFSGKEIADLASFTVTRDGKTISAHPGRLTLA